MQAPNTVNGRPISLVDLMILVVSMAVWLAFATPAFEVIANLVRSGPSGYLRTPGGAVQLGRYVNIIVQSFLFAMIPACLILRLRRPRPRLRTLIHQPGFAACAALLASVLVALPLYICTHSGPAGEFVAAGSKMLFAVVVPAAWIFLLATHRWGPEPSWIDRLGRTLGMLWTVSFPAHLVLLRLPT